MSRNRIARLLSLTCLTSLLSGCVSGDVRMVVAPRLGQATDCVPWMPVPDDVAAWLDGNPKAPPAGYRAWAKDWLQDQVKPKLNRDCAEE
jgi:hypothetical protein